MCYICVAQKNRPHVFFVRERETGGVKVSMRSDGSIDVSQLCARNNGGGHKMAAGCAFDASIDEAKVRIIEQIESSFYKG